MAMVLSGFGLLALALAAVGIYGVIAYSVTQRSQEIGIRMALGAQQSQVLLMVMTHALKLTGIGIVAGAIGALALTRVMEDLLFSIRPYDPVTFGAVAALLGAIALAASYLPGLRATRVDPVVALRSE
jgi:ABC-type antimicrobial peptide transport system permease subunit